MDDALLEVFVEHHNKSDHAQNGWKPHVYTHAIRNVKDKCNKDITKDNISGRMRTLDHHYEVVSKILSQSGFGWDWTNNRLSMDSDDVWAKYVEASKEIKSYKTKVMKNWESICIVYSKDHANGEGAKTGAEIVAEPLGWRLKNEKDIQVAAKRQQTGDAILCMLGDMKKDLVDAFKTTEPIPLPKVTTAAEILDALRLIPDLAEQDMLRCYGKLVLNDRLFQALKELPITMRKTWLLMFP
ncbi:hypothetical protein CFC21_080720 [Triticum aestivum]|uniref:Myb/SANT-like domain-containing protein n=2 Tax=Triticum aestivum TaxID=4565 RepID=A0A9R1I2S6_WHEAT|nr:hypothetical protein CFC21_080720 [Triticum aestivum]